MKKIIISMIIGVSLIGSVSLFLNEEKLEVNSEGENVIESSVDNNTTTEDIEIVQNSISYYKKFYDNVDMFIEDSSNIIVGEVISAVGTTNLDGNIYTDLDIKVKEVLDGNIKKNQTILLRSKGGEISYQDYVSKVDKNKLNKIGLTNEPNKNKATKIKSYVDGIEQYKKGDQVVLFLQEHNPVVEVNEEKDSLESIDQFYLTHNDYLIVGDVQGKFYYDETTNKVYRYKSKDSWNEFSNLKSAEDKELEIDLDKLKVKFK